MRVWNTEAGRTDSEDGPGLLRRATSPSHQLGGLWSAVSFPSGVWSRALAPPTS